jgi:N-ethylmaleimide reductase
LVELFANGLGLAAWDQATFYTPGPKGYTDYPRVTEKATV